MTIQCNCLLLRRLRANEMVVKPLGWRVNFSINDRAAMCDGKEGMPLLGAISNYQ
jgi:hypothetical protein